MDNQPTAGRVFLFVRPTSVSQQTPSWKDLVKTIATAGAQVHEECSGGIPGYEHADLIISATLKDFGRIPQVITSLRQYGLKVAVTPWVEPNEFTKMLGQSSYAGSGAASQR